jgi:2-polyprenyl-3-methyl-5-hydroxy-6-metoxy-1,4-benzoquinol methylase
MKNMNHVPSQSLENCPVCGNFLRRKVNQIFFQCRECGLLIRGNINLENIDEQYKTGWESPALHLQQTGATDSNLSSSFTKLLLKSLNLKNFQNKKILDFGAGRGIMANALRDAGADVTCVEPYGVDLLRQAGFRVYESLKDLPAETKFDGIVCLDVVEHLFNPWSDLTQIRKYLAVLGWLYISTLNSSSLNSTLYGINWRERKNPGHIYLFNSENLFRTLKFAGFQNIKKLKWRILYHQNWLYQLKDYILLQSGWDGELRFLAFRGRE